MRDAPRGVACFRSRDSARMRQPGLCGDCVGALTVRGAHIARLEALRGAESMRDAPRGVPCYRRGVGHTPHNLDCPAGLWGVGGAHAWELVVLKPLAAASASILGRAATVKRW